MDASALHNQPESEVAPPKGRVLVVDDNRTTLTKMRLVLRNMGYETITAQDGATALRCLAEQPIDLVLLDIVMPGLSGFDILRAMKADPLSKAVPVVVISATSDEAESVAKAIELGADDFLPKNFEPMVLRARVSASIERKRLRDMEVQYLSQVARLSQAAAVLEAGDFDPRELDLVDVVARPDGLGKLARVFVSMAEKVYERERRLRKTIARLDHSYHLSGLALVMFAATLWATVGVASQLVPHDMAIPDEVYGFARTVVAGPALFICALLAGGISNVIPKKGSLGQFLIFGVCCAVFQIGLFRSFSLLGVTITVFLTVCLPPVIAVTWSVWRSTEAVSRHVISAMLMALVGLVAFSTPEASGGAFLDMLLGLAFSIAASVAFVLMSQAARRLAVQHSPLLISGLGLTVTAIILAPVAFIISPNAPAAIALALADGKTLGVMIYLGLIPTALAYVCYCSGMARCRSAIAGLVASMIEPAVAAGLAFLFLKEILSPWEVMGCVMLFFAMLTLWLDETPKQDDAPVSSAATRASGP